MTVSVRGAQLRGDLATFRERVPRGTYPSALRERAVGYTAERVRDGAAAAEIAAELGVREVTARRWIDKASAGAPSPTGPAVRGPALSLIPLVVGGQRLDACRPRLRIELLDGTRVHASGLAVSDVVEAIQALRRGR
jgi:transposase-like protein